MIRHKRKGFYIYSLYQGIGSGQDDKQPLHNQQPRVSYASVPLEMGTVCGGKVPVALVRRQCFDAQSTIQGGFHGEALEECGQSLRM